MVCVFFHTVMRYFFRPKVDNPEAAEEVDCMNSDENGDGDDDEIMIIRDE